MEKNIALVLFGIVAVVGLVCMVLLFAQTELAGASQFSQPVKKTTQQAKSAEQLGGMFGFCQRNPEDPRCQSMTER